MAARRGLCRRSLNNYSSVELIQLFVVFQIDNAINAVTYGLDAEPLPVQALRGYFGPKLYLHDYLNGLHKDHPKDRMCNPNTGQWQID